MATRQDRRHAARDYARRGAKPTSGPTTVDETEDQADLRYADDDKVRAAGERAVSRWAGLLRRLSE